MKARTLVDRLLEVGPDDPPPELYSEYTGAPDLNYPEDEE